MNAVDKKMIGDALKTKRREKRITQQQLAGLTGLSRSYIADIENGRYTPSINTLTKLAKPLDIDLNFLLSPVGKPTLEKQEVAL